MQQTKSIRGYRGSLQNLIMSNNSSQPVAGQPATILHYTDRSVVYIDSVSKDGKTCTTTNGETYTYRHGAWRKVVDEIVFTKDFLSQCGNKFPFQVLSEELSREVWDGHPYPQKVVDGITRKQKAYFKISILFGVNDPYRDPHF